MNLGVFFFNRGLIDKISITLISIILISINWVCFSNLSKFVFYDLTGSFFTRLLLFSFIKKHIIDEIIF